MKFSESIYIKIHKQVGCKRIFLKLKKLRRRLRRPNEHISNRFQGHGGDRPGQ